PVSPKRTVRPSADKSPGTDQSSQDKSRSLASPGARPTIPARSLPRVSSTFPSRPTSSNVNSPGTRASSRTVPARLTAYKDRSPPVRVAVNHISSPLGPCNSLNAVPAGTKSCLFPGQINHGNRPTIVAQLGVVNKGDGVCFLGNANMTNPSIGFIEHLTRGKLQALPALLLPHNRQSASIRRPISPFHILHDLPRSAADQRHAREYAGIEELGDRAASQRKRHFAGRRDGEDVGSGWLQIMRLRAFRPRGEQLQRFAFPRRTVDDGLAVRSKTCSVNHASTECERMVDRQCGLHRALP